ncbi:MAG: GHKL domain-containing protein [Clostridia bacterium]|nr:GHKL domain-containing protein [Clostridia bacterium]
MQKLKYLIYIAILTYLIISIKELIKMRKAKNRIEQLEISNRRLQKNYDSIRSFKHDFNNIMQSMGGYIALKDMDGLEKMYKSIVKECQEINDVQGINENVINNPALYNLINHKYEEALKHGIRMKVEVLINLKKLKVNDLDLCRVLGILIDNAIEASRECEDKFISIKFLHDKINNRDLIIVENSCKNCLIDINKIYEKGFSSKREKINHGLGLWKVRQILRKNKNIQIYTARDKLFKQQLEIY